MKYNQFSYIPTSIENALEELHSLGFDLRMKKSPKENLEAFCVSSIFIFKTLITH